MSQIIDAEVGAHRAVIDRLLAAERVDKAKNLPDGWEDRLSEALVDAIEHGEDHGQVSFPSKRPGKPTIIFSVTVIA